MEDSLTLEFCQRIPKIELHAHLHGSIRKSTLIELLQSQNIPYDIAWFETKDLKGSFKMFDLIHAAITRLEHLKRIVQEVLNDFADQNTVYMEIRSTPRTFEGTSLEDYVKTLVEEVEKFNQNQKRMTVRVILSISRSEPLEKARATLDLAIKYKALSNSIVGLDFSGNPFVSHFKEFKELFEEGRTNGLKLSLHVAERPTEFTLDETDMVLKMAPERVGHFNYFTENQLEMLQKNKIAVESCPTSNKFTMYLKDYDDHHFDRLVKAGIPLIICTDDIAVFDTDISQEIYRISKAFNMNQKVVKEVVLSGVASIFDESLISTIDEMIRKFE